MKEWEEEDDAMQEQDGEQEGEGVAEDSLEWDVNIMSSPETCIDTGLLDYIISDEFERNVPEMCSSVEEIKAFIREYSPLGENMVSRANRQLERIRKME